MNSIEDIELNEKLLLHNDEPYFIHKDACYHREILSLMSREELLSLKSEVHQDITRIKDQLSIPDDISLTERDNNWRRKAKLALRHKGRGVRLINTALASKKSKRLIPKDSLKSNEEKEEIARKQNEFERRFVNAAKLLLTQSTFNKICELARLSRVDE